MRRRAIIMVVSLLLAGCAQLLPQSCPSGLRQMTRADLYFGRNIGATPGVGDEDWRAFLDSEVTPRFPEGFTVEDASGQWRGTGGIIVREASKHLIVVLSGTPDDELRLSAVREAYKRHFRQDAVLLLESRNCGSF